MNQVPEEKFFVEELTEEIDEQLIIEYYSR